MPRQGDGTYVPPSGVGEIVAAAPADAEDVRGGLLDLGNEITNSLAVDGQSAMSGQLTLASGGTANAPAANFADALQTGIYSGASDELVIAATGFISATFSADLVTVAGETALNGASNTILGDILVRNDANTANTFTVDNATGDAESQGIIKSDDFQYLNGDHYPFPNGTRLMFQNDTAPTGWTKEASATYNDAFLRIVTGSVGTGGSRSFTASGFQILNGSELPAHTHTVDVSGSTNVTGAHTHTVNSVGGSVGRDGSDSQCSARANVTTGSNGNHSHTFNWSGTTGNAGSSTAIPLKYASFIIATKS